MSGRIKALMRYPEKKQPAVTEQELHLIKDTGIEGDFHADGSNNQVSIITSEARVWMKGQEIQGHCFKRFKENVLLEGIDLSGCEPGDMLICGEAVLACSDFVKRCHLDICALSGAGVKCILADHIRYATVHSGGTIRVGMDVSIKRKNENIE